MSYTRLDLMCMFVVFDLAALWPAGRRTLHILLVTWLPLYVNIKKLANPILAAILIILDINSKFLIASLGTGSQGSRSVRKGKSRVKMTRSQPALPAYSLAVTRFMIKLRTQLLSDSGFTSDLLLRCRRPYHIMDSMWSGGASHSLGVYALGQGHCVVFDMHVIA